MNVKKKYSNIISLSVRVIMLVCLLSCDDDKNEPSPLFARWVIEEVVSRDFELNHETAITGFDPCLLDDVFEFAAVDQLIVRSGTDHCAGGAYPYSFGISLTTEPQGDIVGFQILQLANAVEYKLIPQNEYFFVRSLTKQRLEISYLTRCDNGEFCERIFRMRKA